MPALQPDPEPPRFGTPREIREALLPEEVDDFDRQYRAALATAADTFDLAGLDELLDHWRMIARLSQDVDGHRRMLRKAAALEADGPLGSEPWESFRLRHGL